MIKNQQGDVHKLKWTINTIYGLLCSDIIAKNKYLMIINKSAGLHINDSATNKQQNNCFN